MFTLICAAAAITAETVITTFTAGTVAGATAFAIGKGIHSASKKKEETE